MIGPHPLASSGTDLIKPTSRQIAMAFFDYRQIALGVERMLKFDAEHSQRTDEVTYKALVSSGRIGVDIRDLISKRHIYIKIFPSIIWLRIMARGKFQHFGATKAQIRKVKFWKSICMTTSIAHEKKVLKELLAKGCIVRFIPCYKSFHILVAFDRTTRTPILTDQGEM